MDSLLIVSSSWSHRCLSCGERRAGDEKCELIDANDENEARSLCIRTRTRTRTGTRTRARPPPALSQAHTRVRRVVSRKQHGGGGDGDRRPTTTTAGACWRYATCARTQSHANSVAPVGHTDTHSCVRDEFVPLFMYVYAFVWRYVPYINIPGNTYTYTHGVSREKPSRYGFLMMSLRHLLVEFCFGYPRYLTKRYHQLRDERPILFN